MEVFLLKLTLAPALVAGASIIGRRLGQRVAGLLASLPIVGGPILGFFAYDHGPLFAARAAEQTLAGVFSLAAYSVAYGRMACSLGERRRGWAWLVLPASWAVFLASTAASFTCPPSGPVALLLAALGLALGVRLLPAAEEGPPGPATDRRGAPLPYPIELGLRTAATAGLVVALTTASSGLGPDLSGLLTPFPVASTVLLVAAHVTQGPRAAIALLRGFLTGMWGFVLFCAAVAWATIPFGVVPAFALGLAGVLTVQGAIALSALRRRQRAAELPDNPAISALDDTSPPGRVQPRLTRSGSTGRCAKGSCCTRPRFQPMDQRPGTGSEARIARSQVSRRNPRGSSRRG